MFSHKNGNAVKKIISQRFLDPTLLYLKKKTTKKLSSSYNNRYQLL